LFWLIGCLLLHAQTIPQQKDALTLLGLKKEVTDHYFSNGKQAMGNADRAIYLAYKLKDSAALADLFKMYGVMLYFVGNHQKALQYYLKSLKFFKARQDLNGCAGVFNEMGTLYKKNNRLNEVLRKVLFNHSNITTWRALEILVIRKHNYYRVLFKY